MKHKETNKDTKNNILEHVGKLHILGQQGLLYDMKKEVDKHIDKIIKDKNK